MTATMILPMGLYLAALVRDHSYLLLLSRELRFYHQVQKEMGKRVHDKYLPKGLE